MSPPATVLLLHSFGSAGRSWAPVRERLKGPSLAPDLPGFGDAPPLPQPSVDAYAGWVLARMAEAEGAVVLAGASMGGKIAMAAAARRPPNLAGLLLCAPSPPTPEPMEPGERDKRLQAFGDHGEAERSVAASTLASPDSARFREAVEDWLRTDRTAWDWWWSQGSCETLDVSAAHPPILVLAGAEDDHLGAEIQRRETLPRLAGAELREVEGSGHLLALDRPDAVADALSELAARA